MHSMTTYFLEFPVVGHKWMVRRGFSVKIEEYGISLFEQLPAPNLALSLSKTDTEMKKK